jgi:hypothetical protein
MYPVRSRLQRLFQYAHTSCKATRAVSGLIGWQGVTSLRLLMLAGCTGCSEGDLCTSALQLPGRTVPGPSLCPAHLHRSACVLQKRDLQRDDQRRQLYDLL